MSRRPSLFNARSKKTNRRNLRNNSTAAEAVLWTYLQRRKLGKKFRRQSSVGPYIVDFFVRKSALLWNWMARRTLGLRLASMMTGERGIWRREGSK